MRIPAVATASLAMVLAVMLAGCLAGCTAELTTGGIKLDLELKEYARKPALDYLSSLLQKDAPADEEDEPAETDDEVN